MLRPDKESITAEKLRENVDKLLINSEYPQKLVAMKQSFERSGGILRAVEVIFSLVEKKQFMHIFFSEGSLLTAEIATHSVLQPIKPQLCSIRQQ